MYQARPRPRASRSGGEGSNHDATSFIKSPFLLHVSVTFLKMQVPFFFPSQDFKKTTKLTWIAESSKAPLLPTIAVHFDDVISKPVLTKNDDFKDHINKDSKVTPEAGGRINVTVEFDTFVVNFVSKLLRPRPH